MKTESNNRYDRISTRTSQRRRHIIIRSAPPKRRNCKY